MNLGALTNAITQILSVLTIVADIFLVLAFGLWLLNRCKIFLWPVLINFKNIFAPHALKLIFGLTLAAGLGSLFYSELAGLPPCPLCWYQRIFMYPIVLLAALGIWRRNAKEAAPYILSLAIPGALIAFYHWLLQLGLTPELLPCSNIPGAIPCATAQILEFGYVTIPAMSLTVFLMVIWLLCLVFTKSRVSDKIR